MKNQKKPWKFALLAMLSLSLILTSCKKGDTGPTGPQGTAGKDGNANVKNQNLFVSAGEWANTAGNSRVTKLVPEITADIVNKGAVMVYIEGVTSGSWDALPTTYTNNNGVVFTWSYTIEAGKLKLDISFNSTTALTGQDIGDNNFKVVTIAGSARMANPDVDLNNYSDVKTTYQLSE